jgi:small subunit ribosomal protein S6
MREYEAMIVAKADLPEAELTKMVSKWESIVAVDGGQIIKKDVWGPRRLSYPINKQNRGSYYVYDLATSSDNIAELSRILKIDQENVLRSIIIKLADHVDVDARRIELQKKAEEAAQKAAEAAREKAEMESMAARRGGREGE